MQLRVALELVWDDIYWHGEAARRVVAFEGEAQVGASGCCGQ